MLGGKWSGMVWPGPPTPESSIIRVPDTGVDTHILKELGQKSVEVPSGFEIHSRLKRHIKGRLDTLDKGTGIDWATGEALAWGSLMREGHDVRISGQDVGRGTFSHRQVTRSITIFELYKIISLTVHAFRHAMLVDQNTQAVVVPLNNSLPEELGRLELANSSLSELAVLGFEYGLSWERPDSLAIWEAQFGDFFNGAQVVIDTFISSGEAKWLKQSGIVILLPHGLDGAGPEHSSMRMERFLQLTNDSYEYDSSLNISMHIANPTTPAQYFHLLRRQQLRNYRKPLILVTPKGLLRAPAASSNLSDFAPGTKFQPVLLDPSINEVKNVESILVCSGKVYYDLVNKRTEKELQGKVAIIRIEELAPFPWMALSGALKTHNVERRRMQISWVQEEPKNQGPWPHVGVRLESMLSKNGDKLKFVGRKESPVPAAGVGKIAKQEKEEFLEKAFEKV
ncbi:hypothetical protein M422DRAFT_195265 [Sphaerobolus stellatus SS14]|uniref:Transketolase-like pyrimidine-binding domain-containing protein n=1 Tax=Sphaerobolus stellatus (strain SS14) TaxID=990650 RepID=A0A0C9T564_SPHS4|nr:hypothetical protein M422DRAFT_195265 [Sphaerobolus stellatus SS14]